MFMKKIVFIALLSITTSYQLFAAPEETIHGSCGTGQPIISPEQSSDEYTTITLSNKDKETIAEYFKNSYDKPLMTGVFGTIFVNFGISFNLSS